MGGALWWDFCYFFLFVEVGGFLGTLPVFFVPIFSVSVSVWCEAGRQEPSMTKPFRYLLPDRVGSM